MNVSHWVEIMHHWFRLPKNLASKNCPIFYQTSRNQFTGQYWAIIDGFSGQSVVQKTVGPIVLNQGPRVDEVKFSKTFRWSFFSN